ncbi:DUF2490 domain-containing protein [Sphingomonas cannabina]|uniref:DUF2490 domain-containing protein n=1 Tax=Sphingomonas cannabina TaxID=2899123 RepID=UPI001F16C391|nr:DUF2490 domain-containing protein [Sphingomonas cannabina]UIJ46724.1 DUF2490 domain-containing protein [Sphingomonas cannabina]
MRRICLALLALTAPAAAHAQQADEQLWLQANATTQTGDTTLTFETIGRFSDDADGFSHSEIGGLASVPVAKGVDLAFGYRHVEDWDHGHALPNEERLRQMVTVALGSGFAVRARFEQRFNSSGNEVGFRVRPQLRFTRPLTRGGLALFATHESYFNANTTRWGQRRGYERIRNAFGLSFPLLKALRADLGYLNQLRFGRRGARDRMDHAMTFAFNYSF